MSRVFSIPISLYNEGTRYLFFTDCSACVDALFENNPRCWQYKYIHLCRHADRKTSGVSLVWNIFIWLGEEGLGLLACPNMSATIFRADFDLRFIFQCGIASNLFGSSTRHSNCTGSGCCSQQRKFRRLYERVQTTDHVGKIMWDVRPHKSTYKAEKLQVDRRPEKWQKCKIMNWGHMQAKSTFCDFSRFRRVLRKCVKQMVLTHKCEMPIVFVAERPPWIAWVVRPPVPPCPDTGPHLYMARSTTNPRTVGLAQTVSVWIRLPIAP